MGANLERSIEKPIFIFGCCNSGTTILLNSLLTHESLYGPEIDGQDLEGLPDSMRHHLGNSTFRMWAHHLFSQGPEGDTPGSNLAYYVTEDNYNEDDRGRIVEAVSDLVHPESRLVMKSPADTLRARLIQSYFPDAHFISVVRNGYAVAEGIRRKREYDPDRPQYQGLITSIEDAAEQWQNANRVVCSYEDLNLLERYKIIRYEDLVANPEETVADLLSFCELDSSNFTMPHFRTDLNKEQINRLSGDEIQVVTDIARPMLERFDYDILS